MSEKTVQKDFTEEEKKIIEKAKLAEKEEKKAKAKERRLARKAKEQSEKEKLIQRVYAYDVDSESETDSGSDHDQDESVRQPEVKRNHENSDQESDSDASDEELPEEKPVLTRQTGSSRKTTTKGDPSTPGRRTESPTSPVPEAPKKRGRPAGSKNKLPISVDQQLKDLKTELKTTKRQASYACDLVVKLREDAKKRKEKERREAAKKKAGGKNIIIQTTAPPSTTEKPVDKKTKDGAQKLLDMFS
jgi:hypothetical protein